MVYCYLENSYCIKYGMASSIYMKYLQSSIGQPVGVLLPALLAPPLPLAPYFSFICHLHCRVCNRNMQICRIAFSS